MEPSFEHLSRPKAIALLRERLSVLADDEHCACAVAADKNVFCHGLRDLSDAELRRRFSWIAGSRPGVSREELERLISAYHLGRQQVAGFTLCCDVETREHCGCDGWNMFENAALEKAYEELTGFPITIA